MYLFFDTETNGVPKRGADFRNPDDWPRITQLAWSLYSEQGNLIMSRANLIRPDGWTIPKEKFFIENNMSTERCAADGIPIALALTYFVQAVNVCKVAIAHNVAFDRPIVGGELMRANITPNKKPAYFCTMKSTTDLCRIPHPSRKGYKWPKLEELHRYLFGVGFDGAHDALEDVRALARCYFELHKRNLIQ